MPTDANGTNLRTLWHAFKQRPVPAITLVDLRHEDTGARIPTLCVIESHPGLVHPTKEGTHRMSDDPMSSALLHIEELESRCEHLETDRNNLALALETALRERDEARREILLWVKERCSWVELKQEIKQRGWEYLKEDHK
jgi:hypothetical protein